MNVPKLRFKEFNDEWYYKIFDELINIKSESYNPSLNKENYKCIELEHINQNTGTINGYCNSQDQKSNKNIFKKNEVLFGKLRPYLKKYWYATFDGVCSSEIWVGKSKNQNIVTNKFIYDLFQSHYFLQLCNLSTGSKMPRADWSFIKEQSIAIPNILEQKKISETLELLDKKIELQSKKIEDLKLFTKNTISSELNNLQNYNIFKFKDICNIQTGKSNTQDKCDDGIYPFYIRSENIERSNNYIFDCEAVLTIGDGNIGKVFFYKNGKFDCHQRVYVLNNFKNVLGKYVYYYFSSFFYKRAMSMSAKNTVDSVRMEMISDMIIKVPQEKEQIKMINLFSCLDKKLGLEQNKLDKLQELKKGLMQNMFV